MLKTFVHITLITALFMQQLQMVVVCAVFKAQQSYLTKNECVNRNSPHNQCKAHCQLSKRISEQEKKESTNQIPFKEQTEFVAGFHKPVVSIKLFSETGLTWAHCIPIKILSGFSEYCYPPPEQG